MKRLGLLLLLGSWLLGACASEASSSACVSDETQPCDCVIDGQPWAGIQTCDAANQGWSSCACDAPGDSGSSPGAGPDASDLAEVLDDGPDGLSEGQDAGPAAEGTPDGASEGDAATDIGATSTDGDVLRCERPDACSGAPCTEGVCGAPSCNDGVLNGDETYVDCGGSCPLGCDNTRPCEVGGDCQSGCCADSGVCDDDTDADGRCDVDDACPGADDAQFVDATCQACVGNYALPTCEVCLPNFTGELCESCINDHFADETCTTCAPQFVGSSCDACAPNFTGEECDTCIHDHFADETCSVCLPSFMGASCDECVDPLLISPYCDKAPPELQLDWPAPSLAFLVADEGPWVLSGTVMDSALDALELTINEVAVPVATDGSFSLELSPTWGANVFVVVARDVAGQEAAASLRFLYSDAYASPAASSPASLHLGQARLDGTQAADEGAPTLSPGSDVVTVADGLGIIESAAVCEALAQGVDAEVPVNGFELDLGMMSVSVSGQMLVGVGAEIGSSALTWGGCRRPSLRALDDGLALGLSCASGAECGACMDLHLPLLLTVDLDLTVESALGTEAHSSVSSLESHQALSLSEVSVLSTLTLDKVPGGALETSAGETLVTLAGVEAQPPEDVSFEVVLPESVLHPSVALELTLSDLVDSSVFTDTLSAQLTGSLSTCLNELLAKDSFTAQLEAWILGFGQGPVMPLAAWSSAALEGGQGSVGLLDSVSVSAQGITLGLSYPALPHPGQQGAIRAGGCLGGALPASPLVPEPKSGLAVSADALNQALHAAWAMGGLDGEVPALLGDAYPELSTSWSWGLPPVWGDCGEGASLRMPAIALTVFGEHDGVSLEETMLVDASAVFGSSPSVTIGDCDIAVYPLSLPAELQSVLEQRVAAQLAVALGDAGAEEGACVGGGCSSEALGEVVAYALALASQDFASPWPAEAQAMAPLTLDTLAATSGWLSLLME